ncbi:MAG: DUF72 domain-containing protein [Terriglobales bacterium]
MALRVGTSGWAYTAWKPGFYPASVPSRKFLEFYSSRLNAVEANYTFRHYLTEQTIAGWLDQTPANFQFAVKAHQSLTHLRRLKNVDESLPLFLDSLLPLKKARRLGPVLFQLPPNFKADVGRLDDFLRLLPRGLRVAIEFRHRSWFTDETYDVLRRRKAALCIAESDELQTPEVFTADFAYFRLRRSKYSPAARRTIAIEMQEHARELKDVYAFFKHEENPSSPKWAVELLRRSSDMAG